MVELGGSGFAKRGDDFRQKGEAALKGGFFSNMFGSKTERVDQALEYFKQAANCYKQCSKHREAMEMFLKCADCEAEEAFKANHLRDAALIIKN